MLSTSPPPSYSSNIETRRRDSEPDDKKLVIFQAFCQFGGLSINPQLTARLSRFICRHERPQLVEKVEKSRFLDGDRSHELPHTHARAKGTLEEGPGFIRDTDRPNRWRGEAPESHGLASVSWHLCAHSSLKTRRLLGVLARS